MKAAFSKVQKVGLVLFFFGAIASVLAVLLMTRANIDWAKVITLASVAAICLVSAFFIYLKHGHE